MLVAPPIIAGVRNPAQHRSCHGIYCTSAIPPRADVLPWA